VVLRAGDQALCYCFVLVLLQTCRLLRAAACCRSTQRGWRRSSTLCFALGGGRRRRRRREELCPQRAICCGGWAKDPGGLGGRQQEGRGQITLEVVGPARQNNSDLAHHQNRPQNRLNGVEKRSGAVPFTTFCPFKPCVDRLDGSNVYITAQGINEAVSLRLPFKPV